MGKFLTYTEAQKVAREAGFQNLTEYRSGYQQYPGLPSSPDVFYKSEWQGWKAFLHGDSKFLSYDEATKVAQAAGFSSKKDYLARYKSFPGLPSSPNFIYKERWVNWVLFLTGHDTRTKCSYEEARQLVREHGVKSMRQYKDLTLKFSCLPAFPRKFYKEEWQNNYHFFGKTHPEDRYTIEQAREIAIKAGVQTFKQYQALHAADDRLPNPHRIAREQSFLLFLQKPKPQPKYTFEEAKKVVRELGIKSSTEYMTGLAYQRDPRLPSTPTMTYKASWKGWQDYLGVKKGKQYLCYEKAKEAARALAIVNSNDYRRRYREVEGLPPTPHKQYQSQWEGWPGFLGEDIYCSNKGKGRKASSVYLSLEEAKKAVKQLSIVTYKQYAERYKLVQGLPSDPKTVYADHWKGWPDFIGLAPDPNGIVRRKMFLSFEEAKAAVKANNIKTSSEYLKTYKRIEGLPSMPYHVYQDQWKSWADFLGSNIVSWKFATYLSFDEAKIAVRTLKIATSTDYVTKYKQMPGLPSSPYRVYKEQWKGWTDFLGRPRKGA